VPTSPPTEVRDVSGRNLMGNLTTSTTGAVSWNDAQQGMTMPSISGGSRAVSEKASGDLLSLLTDEFSLEFWMRSPINERSQKLLIAGFGDWAPGSPFPVCNATETTNDGGWRLYSTLGGGIQFTGVFSVGGIPTCVTTVVSITTIAPRHLVARGRNGRVSIRTHGSVDTISSISPVFTPSLWGRYSAPLTLANPHVENAWVGSLFMVAMYDRYLSDAEVAEKRDQGLPNSVPKAAVNAVNSGEDEEATLVEAV